MITNWYKTRRIILNDRWRRCYKPDKEIIRKIGRILPNSNIFGFGFSPQLGYWTLLVQSESFPDNPDGVIRDMGVSDLYAYSKPVALLPKKGWFT